MTFTFLNQPETERILYAVGVSTEVMAEAVAFNQEGRKINAIKAIRDAAGGRLSLKEAKEAAEQMLEPVTAVQVGWFVSEDNGATWTYRVDPILIRPAMIGPA